MTGKTIITPEQKKEILDLYTSQKIYIKDIARKFHIGNGRASEILKEMGAKVVNLSTQKVTSIEEQKIIKMYVEDGYSLSKIARQLKLSRETIGLYLRKNKIIDKLRVAKYNIDESYFENIDSHEKAYWLGILLTDGYLYEKKNSIALHIQSRDIQLLENFKRCIQSNSPIKYYSNGEGKYGKREAVIFIFGNKKIANDLKKFGMKQNKSLTVEFPNIDNKYIFSFLCGVFDGDGCYSLAKSKTGYLKFSIKMLTASKAFAKGILDASRMLGYPLNNDKRLSKFGTILHGVYTSNRNYAVEFLGKLYENLNENIYLKRKHDTYLRAKQSLIDSPVNIKCVGPSRLPQNYKITI